MRGGRDCRHRRTVDVVGARRLQNRLRLYLLSRTLHQLENNGYMVDDNSHTDNGLHFEQRVKARKRGLSGVVISGFSPDLDTTTFCGLALGSILVGDLGCGTRRIRGHTSHTGMLQLTKTDGDHITGTIDEIEVKAGSVWDKSRKTDIGLVFRNCCCRK